MADKNNIKNKLGLHRLGEFEKKELFDKFVDGGGKVINAKKKGSTSFDRTKQKKWIDKIASRKGKLKADEIDDYLDDSYVIKNFIKTKKISFKSRIFVYIRGLFNKVITFNGKKVNEKFFKLIIQKIIPNLKNFDSIMGLILSAGEHNLLEIKKNLEDKGTYYYTLLVKYNDFYNAEEYNTIVYFYNKRHTMNITPKHLEDPIKSILKKIYILRKFIAGSLTSLSTALFITAKYKRWDKATYHRRLNQIKYSLNLIFYQLLPKLHSLLLFILEENFPLNSRRIISFLKIKDMDKVDYVSHGDDVYQGAFPEIPSILKKGKNDGEVKYIEKYFYELDENDIKNMGLEELDTVGMMLMKDVDFKGIFNDQKELLPLEVCPEDDKLLHVFIYLKEFEKEYSFILTSYKINITPLFENNKRMDYKAKLNDLYTPLNSIYDNMKDYLEAVKNIENIKSDKLMNEYDKYNRLNSLEGKKGKEGFELKKTILEYFIEIKQYFDRFINDYNTQKRIIENPDDVLKFDKDVEGSKKVEGKSIIDAIIDADAYISALLYRLDEGGDLSGIKTTITQLEIPEIQEPQEGDEEISEELKEVSFLDEIEDSLGK